MEFSDFSASGHNVKYDIETFKEPKSLITKGNIFEKSELVVFPSFGALFFLFVFPPNY